MGLPNALPLMILAAALGAAGGSLAAYQDVPEVEPNNDIGNATLLGWQDYGSGSASRADVDFWKLPAAAGDFVAFQVQDGTPCDRPRLFLADNTTLDYAPYHTAYGGLLSVYVPSREPVFIEMCGGLAAPPYYIEAFFYDHTPSAEGPAETEPNDDLAHAEVLAPAGGVFEGVIDPSGTDIDALAWMPAADGWARVLFHVEPGTGYTVNTRAGAVNYTPFSVEFDSGALFEVSAGDPVFFAFGLHRGAYSITVEVAGSLAEFSEGEGESEPNDAAENATELRTNGTYGGVFHELFDTADYFRFSGQSGDYVALGVRCEGQSLHDCNAVGSAGPGVWVYDSSGSLPEWRLRVFLRNDADLVFFVSGDGTPMTYLVNATIVRTYAYDDGEADVAELVGFPGLPATIQTSLIYPPPPAAGFDLGNGEGALVGPVKCLHLDVSNLVVDISVRAGMVMENPVEPNRWVAARTVNGLVLLNPDAAACFDVLLWSPSGAPAPWLEHLPNGFAKDRPAAVVAEVDKRHANSSGALLALWAVTSEISSFEARDEWNGTDAMLVEARAILDASGVGYCNTGLANRSCAGYSGDDGEPNRPGTAMELLGGLAAVAAGGTTALAYLLWRKKRGGRPGA